MDLKHIIPQQRRRTYGPSFDIAYSADKSNVSRVGPDPVFSRASSGTFVNENRRIVGKTTSTTSLNPASVSVGGIAVFTVPSGSVVGWLNNSVVVVMEDTDGNDQIGAERHVTGTLIHKTDTAITLLVTSKVGTTTLSSWSVSYRGIRIDHNPNTGLCLGHLHEASRTNLILQSENHGSATWAKTGGSISSVTNTAPNGSVNSNLFSEDSSTGFHRIFQASSYVSGSVYTISVFLKYAGRQFIAITHPVVASNNVGIFDIQNGIVTLAQSNITASISRYPNRWWRCSITGTSSSTASQSHLINGSTSGTTVTTPYAGLNGPAFYIYGSQVELGRHASSYIPTGASSAIRSDDINSITGTSFSGYFSQIEGTLSCKATNLSGIADTGLLGTVSLTASDRSVCAVNLYRNGNLQLRSEVVQGSPAFTTAASFIFAATSGIEGNTAISFKQDDFASANNGSSVQTDTSGIFPSSTLTQMLIGTNGAQRMFGWISNIKYYPKRLTNSSLQTITAIVTNTITYNGVAIWYNGEGIIETS